MNPDWIPDLYLNLANTYHTTNIGHIDTQVTDVINQSNYLFILGILNTMVLLALLGYIMSNVLLAWATLHQPYISTPK